MKRTSRAAQPLLTIHRIEAIPVCVPLVKPVLMGGGQKFDHSETLIVRIETRDGLTGWGEASAAPTMTGDTLAGMVAAVNQHLAPLLKGANALNLAQLAWRMSLAIIGNTGAKAACDIALHDLVGKHYGVPVVQLLGGKARDAALLQLQLGNPNIADDIAEARQRWKQGYRFFKLKVGVKPVTAEIAAARAIRKALGPQALLCADANMGLTAAHARAYVHGAAAANLLFLEQPLRDNDHAGMLALSRISPIPLCADESLHSVESIMACHRAGSIAGVNLKAIKLGGIAETCRAAIISDALGLAVDLASKTGESSIAAAALTHIAYAIPNLDWGININNHYLATDLVRAPLLQRNGSVDCPSGPGLGVEVNEAAIGKFRVRV